MSARVVPIGAGVGATAGAVATSDRVAAADAVLSVAVAEAVGYLTRRSVCSREWDLMRAERALRVAGVKAERILGGGCR